MKLAFLFFNLCLISTLTFAEESYPWDLLKDPKFRDAYRAMLGEKSKQKWLSTLSGPAEPAKKITIAGAEYMWMHSCKAHDCDTHNIVIIYSPASAHAYAKLSEEGAVSILGNPNAEIKAGLDKLYNDEFSNTN